MTPDAVLGLAALNVLYLAAGSAVLWIVRGWRSWGEYVRLGGVSYLTGIAVLGALWTAAVVAGVPYGWALVLGTAAALVAAAVPAGRMLGRTAPSRPRAGRVAPTALIGAAAAAATAVVLEALFRSARLAGVYSWDAWAFWIPKGKALYHFGELDPAFLASLPAPAYPPLVPLLDAAAFHAMGGAHVATLHLQFWFFVVGFVAAAAGLLSERAPSWLVWPFLLLVLVMPRAGERLVVAQADFLLDFLVVVAALLVLAWVRDDERWQLVLGTLLLVGAVLTKREGLLLAACVVGAALLATVREPGRWRWLVAAGGAVALATVPWRLYATVERPAPWVELAALVAAAAAAAGALWLLGRRGRAALPWLLAGTVAAAVFLLRETVLAEGVAPAGAGLESGAKLGRVLPSLRLSVETFLAGELWSVVPLLAPAAVALALLARVFAQAGYAAALLALTLLGGAWVLWSDPALPLTADESLTPIVRYTAAAVLAAAVLSPALLAEAWRARREARPAGHGRVSAWAAFAVAGVPALAYPVAALAGGLPRFPSPADCARPPEPGRPVDVVFGQFEHPGPASALRAEVRRHGFLDVVVEPDDCGGWEVVVPERSDVPAGREVVVEAERVGFEPRLEAHPR